MMPFPFDSSLAMKDAFVPLTNLFTATPQEALAWIRWIGTETHSHPQLRPRIARVERDVRRLFGGTFPGYSACDTPYHDLGHTLSLLAPFCQIAVALEQCGSEMIGARELELGLIALLLHDAGYVKEEGDFGSGAKYTFRHIDRSVAFARTYLGSTGLEVQDILSVEKMIWCTDLTSDRSHQDFPSQGCQLLGYALGTADLLAQMADPRYLAKLPLLLLELQEAYAFEGPEGLKAKGIQPFKDLEALIEATPGFYAEVVVGRLKAMGSLAWLLEDPITGRNPYLDSIHAHLETIRDMVHSGGEGALDGGGPPNGSP